MQNNIKCLISACNNLTIKYEPIDKENNLIRLYISGKFEYFQLNKTPFNSEVVYSICRDKMHTYELIKSHVCMPKTLSFLDWKVNEQYKKYIKRNSESTIINSIESEFDYPIVLKKNQGALGDNVFLCKNRNHCITALNTIFNKQSNSYDYVALAQQYIPTHEEYRLVCAFGKPVLSYQRGNACEFNKEYWLNGENARLIENQEIIDELYQFIKPIYTLIDIGFVGFDIIRGKDNELYLIELNSSPRFDHIIDGSGDKCVINMYEKSLTLLCENNIAKKNINTSQIVK